MSSGVSDEGSEFAEASSVALDDQGDAVDDNDPNLSVEDEHEPHFNNLLSFLEWKFELVDHDAMQLAVNKSPTRPLYNGPSGLRSKEVALSFQDPFECFRLCGGFSNNFVERLTSESNDYFVAFIKPKLGKNHYYCGLHFNTITFNEMHVFLGILLRISMEERDGGGYAAYFAPCDRVIRSGYANTDKQRKIPCTKGWAQNYMPLKRFKQIRGAFHPMSRGAGSGGDKCYQLRNALNCLNKAAKEVFLPSGNLAFDEGGVACRSRLCPVRQYNKDKPDKYRVDFFILADSKHTNILHMDVYQGGLFICDYEPLLSSPTTNQY
jgi:Transposase IS4